MDDLDKAKNLEMQQREQALQQTLSAPDHDYGETPDVVDGIHYCLDCGTEIPDARLAIVPHAVRCVDCKEFWEQSK